MLDKNFSLAIDYIKKKPGQSYLIAVDEEKIVDKFVFDLQKSFELLASDILTINKTKDNGKIKIVQIQALAAKLILKPAGAYRLVYLRNAETLTLEAANALLKNLEEPSTNIIFLLFTKSIDQVIPTISSRCPKLILRSDNAQKINQDDIYYLKNFLIDKNLAQKFELVNQILISGCDIKKLLTSWLLYLRQNPDHQNKNRYKTIYRYLRKHSTQINQKLFLENLILSFGTSPVF